DWSSDVCSSDLAAQLHGGAGGVRRLEELLVLAAGRLGGCVVPQGGGDDPFTRGQQDGAIPVDQQASALGGEAELLHPLLEPLGGEERGEHPNHLAAAVPDRAGDLKGGPLLP